MPVARYRSEYVTAPVLDVDLQDAKQLSAADDQQLIRALPTGRAHRAFRIRYWRQVSGPPMGPETCR
jgi:hypothetical protein